MNFIARKSPSQDAFLRNRVEITLTTKDENSGVELLQGVDIVQTRDRKNPVFMVLDLSHPKWATTPFPDELMVPQFNFSRDEAKAIFEVLAQEFLGSEASTVAELMKLLQRERDRNDKLTEHLMELNNMIVAPQTGIRRVPRKGEKDG